MSYRLLINESRRWNFYQIFLRDSEQNKMNYHTKGLLGSSWMCEETGLHSTPRFANKPATKRDMLIMISSVQDPLGFTSPFIWKAKALFQELCRRKIGWDEELPEDIKARWLRWLADLPLISSFAIPRCLHLPSNTSSVELHHFSDASELVYGAVSYLRENENCRLLMSKSRLAPI